MSYETEDILIHWLGAITLILGVIVTMFGMGTYLQDHETIRGQCFDDCQWLDEEYENDCAMKCFEIDNGSIQVGAYSKLFLTK